MRKMSVSIIAILGVFSLLLAADNCFAAQSGKGGMYIGAILLPFETSGLEDIVLSDWVSPNSSIEDRVLLPLSEGKTSGLHPGIVVGYEYAFEGLEQMPFLGELQIVPADGVSIYGVFAGANYKFMQSSAGFEKFSIGLMPKLGYVLGSVNFGQVAITGSGDNTAELAAGDVTEGDAISADFSGLGIQGAITSTYNFTEKVGINAQIGWAQSFLGEMEINAGEVTIDKDSAEVLKPGTYTQAGIDPKAEMSGIFAALAITYRF